MRTFTLFYGHAASNWGDLAINSGVLQLMTHLGLKTSGSGAVQLNPSDGFTRLSATSLDDLPRVEAPRPSIDHATSETLRILADYVEDLNRFRNDFWMDNYDVVLINSGEHLFESSNAANFRDLLWRALPLMAAVEAGQPAVVLPSTLGPFRSNFGIALAEMLGADSQRTAFRDAESHRLSAGGPMRDLPVLLDPGFFAKGLSRAEVSSDRSKTIGIILRLEDYGIRAGSKRSSFVQAKHKNNGFHQSAAFQAFYAVAQQVIRGGDRVRIIIQTRADRDLSSALHTALVDEFSTDEVCLDDPVDMEAYLASIRNLDLLVSSRFHAVVLALAQGVPAVGLYSETHGHKIPGLFSLLEIPRCGVRIDARLASQIADETAQAAQEITSTISDVMETIDALKHTTRDWVAHAIQTRPSTDVPLSPLRRSALSALVSEALSLQHTKETNAILSSLKEIKTSLSDVR